jgi:hypothetical protein
MTISPAVNSSYARNQIVSGSNQYEFDFDFTAESATDLAVYLLLSGDTPSESGNLLVYLVDYTVTFNQGNNGGRVTLLLPGQTGDIITIQSNQATERNSNFSNTNPYTADNLNKDLNACIISEKQNYMLTTATNPRYPYSAYVSPANQFLPILPAGAVWRMNSSGTGISAYVLGADDPSAEALRADLLSSNGASIVGCEQYGTVQEQLDDLQQRSPRYAVDTSVTPNLITVTLSPASVGTPPLSLLVKVANTNNAAVSIQGNTFGPLNIVSNNGSFLDGNSIIGGSVYQFDYDQTINKYRLLGSSSLSLNSYPPGFIKGLECKPGSLDPIHSVEFSPGSARDSSDQSNIDANNNLTKYMNADWVAGDFVGGLASNNTLAAGDTVNGFCIYNPSTGEFDIGFDKNADCSGLLADANASGFTKYVYLDSFIVLDVVGDIQFRPQKRNGDMVKFQDDLGAYGISQANSTTPVVLNASTNFNMPSIKAQGIFFVNSNVVGLGTHLSTASVLYETGAANPLDTAYFFHTNSVRVSIEYIYVGQTPYAFVFIDDLGNFNFASSTNAASGQTNFITAIGWVLRRGAS